MKTVSVLAGTGNITASVMLESTSEANIPELRERLDRDGYLLIRHFLPAPDVEKVGILLDRVYFPRHGRRGPDMKPCTCRPGRLSSSPFEMSSNQTRNRRTLASSAGRTWRNQPLCSQCWRAPCSSA